MANTLPVTFANLPPGLNPMALFDQQFAAVQAGVEDGANLTDGSVPDSKLVDSGVTAGTYTKVTVNGKGIATGGAQASASDLSNGVAGSGAIVLANSPALTSPALSGVPTAPTAATGTDTDQVATTAFVQASAGGNVAADITALASTPSVINVAFLAQIGRQGNFQWSSADLSAAVAADPTQGLYVAPASDPTGGSGAWVRVLDADIQFEWFGTPHSGSGSTVEVQLRSAQNIASTLGLPLVLGPYTYELTCDLSVTILSAVRYYAAPLLSNVTIRGTYGVTTLKLKSGQSSNASPKDLNFFVSATVTGYANVIWDGIIFDHNGANNLINGGSLCNGALDITGDGSFINGMTIQNCMFENCAGTNNLVFGQSNSNTSPVSLNIKVLDCKFYNNGLDTSDHSTIYMWADNAWIDKCYFQQPSGLSTTGRNWVASELHGSNNWFTNNRVLGYYRGCWCASNYYSAVLGQHVVGNNITCWGVGVGIYRQVNSSLTSLADIFIDGNDFQIYYDAGASGVRGAVVSVVDYSVSRMFIRNNHVQASAGAAVYQVEAFVFGCSTSGQALSHVEISDNSVEGCTAGVYARVNTGEGGLDFFSEHHNYYYAMGLTDPTVSTFTSYGSVFYQVGTGSTIGRVSSLSNKYFAQSGVTFTNGVFIGGTITEVYSDGHDFSGVVNNYNLSSPVITTYRGSQFRSAVFNAAPTVGTWVVGDIVNFTTPTASGFIGSVCVTAGSPGTHKTYGVISA